MKKDTDKKDNIMLQSLNPFELIEFIYLKSDVIEVNNALEKYIITVSSHPKIRKDPLAKLPDYPDRVSTAKKYIKSIHRLKIMQNVMRQKAEDSGKIDYLVDKEYIIRLRHRVLQLHKLLSEKGLFDMSKLTMDKFTLYGEGGAVRVLNPDRRPYGNYQNEGFRL